MTAKTHCHVGLLPLVTMLTAGVVSALAGVLLLFHLPLTREVGAGCLVFDASTVASFVALVAGFVTASCALAHLRRHESADCDDEVKAPPSKEC